MTRLNLRFCMILLCSLSSQYIQAATGALLGEGHKAETGATSASCLVAAVGDNWMQNMVMSNPQGSLEFKQVSSYGELQRLLDVAGTIGASAGGWGAEASGGFLGQSANSSQSINIVYVQEFKQTAMLDLKLAQFSSQEAARVLLKEPIRTWYSYAGTQWPAQIYATCGGEFVSSVSAGGLLMVIITIKFTSAEAKNEFNASLKATGNIGGISVSVSGALSAAEKYAKSGTSVSIKAQQFGGQPMNLQDATLGKPDSTGAYQIQKCGSPDVNDPGKCDKLLANVVNYAKTFSDQFYDSNGKLDKALLFYSNPRYTTYNSIFGAMGTVDVSNKKTILSDLRKNYSNLTRDISLIDEYKSRVDDIFLNELPSLRVEMATVYSVLDNYKKNLLAVNKTEYDKNADLKTCFASADKCKTAQLSLAQTPTAALRSKRVYANATRFLTFIKENTFSISDLLTVSNVSDPQKPRFKFMNCDLIPLKPNSGSWIYGLGGCGITGFPVVSVGSSTQGPMITMDSFTYTVKMDGKAYRFTYPKTTLYNYEYADYVPDNEESFPMIKYEKCEANQCTDMGEIAEDQIDDYLGTNAFYIEQQELITLYPNIMY